VNESGVRDMRGIASLQVTARWRLAGASRRPCRALSMEQTAMASIPVQPVGMLHSRCFYGAGSYD
jgi:hypothetical protein